MVAGPLAVNEGEAQLQLARDNGIRVEEIQLDRSLERIAENNNLSLSGFRQMLEKDGVPFDKFREEVRQQIVLQRLREREVDERIEISDAEIDQYLADSSPGAYTNLVEKLLASPHYGERWGRWWTRSRETCSGRRRTGRGPAASWTRCCRLCITAIRCSAITAASIRRRPSG